MRQAVQARGEMWHFFCKLPLWHRCTKDGLCIAISIASTVLWWVQTIFWIWKSAPLWTLSNECTICTVSTNDANDTCALLKERGDNSLLYNISLWSYLVAICCCYEHTGSPMMAIHGHQKCYMLLLWTYWITYDGYSWPPQSSTISANLTDGWIYVRYIYTFISIGSTTVPTKSCKICKIYNLG